MAIQFVDKSNSATVAPDTSEVRNLPDAAGIKYDRISGALVYNADGTLRYLIPGNAAPVNLTAASLTLSPALHAGRTVVVNAVAGSAITLPAATGSGAKYRVVLGTALTSASVTVGVTGNDTFAGHSIQSDAGDSTPADATIFETVNGTTNLWTDAFTGGGGEIGNWFEVEDIKADIWAVKGYQQGVSDPTSPFSNV